MLRDRLRLFRDVLREHRLWTRAVERWLTGQHLVRHGAQRVDVRAVIDVRIRHRLFGRHVRGRPERYAKRRDLGFPGRRTDRLGDTEIRYDRVPLGEQHVVGLDVTMHHAVAMRIRQRVRDLAQHFHRVADGHLALLLDELTQRLPFDEGHHVIDEVVRSAGREQLHDVRVLELGRQLDLALEPLHAHRGRHVRWQHLDHHSAPQLHLLRDEHT